MVQGLDARPYLVALAGAANAGSAATLIGNPQNILIGQAGGLPFWDYLVIALPPTLLALAFTYFAVAWTWRAALSQPLRPAGHAAAPLLDRFQTIKAFAAVAALIALFLTPLPRELGALAIRVCCFCRGACRRAR